MSLEIAGGLFREILRLFRRDRSGTPGRRKSSARDPAENMAADVTHRHGSGGAGERNEKGTRTPGRTDPAGEAAPFRFRFHEHRHRGRAAADVAAVPAGSIRDARAAQQLREIIGRGSDQTPGAAGGGDSGARSCGRFRAAEGNPAAAVPAFCFGSFCQDNRQQGRLFLTSYKLPWQRKRRKPPQERTKRPQRAERTARRTNTRRETEKRKLGHFLRKS